MEKVEGAKVRRFEEKLIVDIPYLGEQIYNGESQLCHSQPPDKDSFIVSRYA